MKKQLPGWAVLLIITLAAGLALGGTYALTKDPIAQQALTAAENARKAALPDADVADVVAVNTVAFVVVIHAGRHKVVVGRVIIDIDVVEMDVIDTVAWSAVIFLAEEHAQVEDASALDAFDANTVETYIADYVLIAAIDGE